MLRTFRTARVSKRKGQAILETGLVLSSLLLMIVGIMDFGQFLFYHQVLTDRARAGARYAATNTYDATSIQNMVVYNSTTAPSGGGAGLFGLTTAEVVVTPTPNTATPTYVQVKITGFPIKLLSPFLTKSYSMRDTIVTRQAEASYGAPN